MEVWLMFCNQCEQTAKGIACTKIGVCGKSHEVDVLQDLLIYALQGLAKVAQAGRKVYTSIPMEKCFLPTDIPN